MLPCDGSSSETFGLREKIFRRRPGTITTERTAEMPDGAALFRKRKVRTWPPPLACQPEAGRSIVTVSPFPPTTVSMAPKNVGSSDPVCVGAWMFALDTSSSFGVGVSRTTIRLAVMG